MDGQHDDDALDLTGLQPRYTQSISRGFRVFLLVMISLQFVLALSRLAGDPDTFDVVLSIVQLLTFVLFLGAYFLWTPATLLTAEGVRVRNGFPKVRTISWDQVREVQVQGGWQDVSVLVLKNGRSQRLVGMPVEHAQRLADALAARTVR